MKLHFTPRARLDLIGIADYIRTRNPAAALAVRQAILGSLQVAVGDWRTKCRADLCGSVFRRMAAPAL
jgi:plasmid stabilization system protein ParE